MCFTYHDSFNDNTCMCFDFNESQIIKKKKKIHSQYFLMDRKMIFLEIESGNFWR